MTNQYLNSLIRKLNKKQLNKYIQLRPLSDTVDFAKIWRRKPSPRHKRTHGDGPLHYYFIKDQEGNYVGIVHDMQTDLHWFVLRKYRGKGYLTNALKEVILPHLFQDRKEQLITIDEYHTGEKYFLASEKVALSLGFVKCDDIKYRLKGDKYKHRKPIKGDNTELTKERIDDLDRQINYLSRSLWVIQTEIEMKMGASDYSRALKKLVDDIKKKAWQLEDIWWENREQSK